MTSIRDKASTIGRTLTQQLRQAAVFTDPMLSPDGLKAKRLELAEKAREDARIDLGGLNVELSSRESQARRANDLPPATADQVAAREAAWRRAQSLLAAKRPVQHLIRSARNREELLMLREELPVHIAASTTPPEGLRSGELNADGKYEWTEADYSWLSNLIDQRLGDLGDSAATTRLTFARELPVDRAAVRSLAGVVNGTTSHIAAGVATNLASQFANMTAPQADPAKS